MQTQEVETIAPAQLLGAGSVCPPLCELAPEAKAEGGYSCSSPGSAQYS